MAIKKILYSVSIAILLLGIFVLWVKWEMWEPSGMEKDSMVYRLKVPDALKAFPTWGELTAPEYDISLPDSSAGPFVARMKYTTSLTLHEVLSEVKRLQFSCEQHTPGRAVCEKVISEGRSIQLFYGKILHNQDENIEVAYLERE